MFDVLFDWQRLRDKHRSAPMLLERTRYLGHLLNDGVSPIRVRFIANLLLHISHTLRLIELRPTTLEEIRNASQVWEQYGNYEGTSSLRPPAQAFYRISVEFFEFHGMLTRPEQKRAFDDLVEQFTDVLRSRSLSSRTIRDYQDDVRPFLEWLSHRKASFTEVQITDVDDYIESKRALGWKPRTVSSVCTGLRSLFRFAEMQGLCQPGIRLRIKSPRIDPYSSGLKCPSWQQVRRVLKSPVNGRYWEYRQHLICVLGTIYGLRASEIAGLRVDDFDWQNEILTVRRAKRGGLQQFPLVDEVGEAVIGYLKFGRPACKCRSLLVTRTTPYRPVPTCEIWASVKRRFQSVFDTSICFGAHSLRHACATQLLRKGASLQEIASFLGHKSLRYVNIYARHDRRMLRVVSRFSLRNIL